MGDYCSKCTESIHDRGTLPESVGNGVTKTDMVAELNGKQKRSQPGSTSIKTPTRDASLTSRSTNSNHLVDGEVSISEISVSESESNWSRNGVELMGKPVRNSLSAISELGPIDPATMSTETRSLFEIQTLALNTAHEVMTSMQTGMLLTKVYTLGVRKKKFIWMSSSLDRVLWGVTRDTPKDVLFTKDILSCTQRRGTLVIEWDGAKDFKLEALKESPSELETFRLGISYAMSVYTRHPRGIISIPLIFSLTVVSIADEVDGFDQCVEGDSVVRHRDDGTIKQLFVWLSESGDRVFWTSSKVLKEDQGKITGMMLTKSITEVSEHFQGSEDSRLAFSIQCLDGSRLNMIGRNKDTQRAWIAVLRFLIEENKAFRN